MLPPFSCGEGESTCRIAGSFLQRLAAQGLATAAAWTNLAGLQTQPASHVSSD